MRLQKVISSGCSRVRDGEYDFGIVGDGGGLVVVTGDTASGKTSLLELVIASKEDAGAYGAPRFLDAWRRRDQPAAKIIAEWKLDDGETTDVGGAPLRIHETIIDATRIEDAELDTDDGLQRVLSRLAHEQPKVEYFHAGRQLPPPAAYIGSGAIDGERHFRMESSDQKFAMLHAFMVELSLGLHEPDGRPNAPGSRAILFDDMVREIAGTIAFAGATRGSSPVPLFTRRDGSLRLLSELSAFERQAVLIAATCVRSNLARSIALLDTPEQACGVEKAANLVAALRKYHPTCQWIVATSKDVAAKVGADRTIEMKGER